MKVVYIFNSFLSFMFYFMYSILFYSIELIFRCSWDHSSISMYFFSGLISVNIPLKPIKKINAIIRISCVHILMNITTTYQMSRHVSSSVDPALGNSRTWRGERWEIPDRSGRKTRPRALRPLVVLISVVCLLSGALRFTQGRWDRESRGGVWAVVGCTVVCPTHT